MTIMRVRRVTGWPALRRRFSGNAAAAERPPSPSAPPLTQRAAPSPARSERVDPERAVGSRHCIHVDDVRAQAFPAKEAAGWLDAKVPPRFCQYCCALADEGDKTVASPHKALAQPIGFNRFIWTSRMITEQAACRQVRGSRRARLRVALGALAR